mmetsp:Transcript_17361/g.23872  ORF Transcript_17361/g.23872 Transcript_17361/m.23872 type:complete len:694 (-) Transcript_17361:730-2811(-)
MRQIYAEAVWDYALSSKTFDLFKGGTALQYISHMVTLIGQRWPNNENYKELNTNNSNSTSSKYSGPKWISDIRESIKKEIQQRCIRTGQQYAEDSQPIGRNLLLASCQELLKENSPTSMTKRSVFVTNFQADGRGGEVATMTANSASWCDIFDALTDDWNQKKTGRQNLMNFFNDWESWEIDFYHSLSGYLMCGAGAGNYTLSDSILGGNFIYPHLACLKGSGAAQSVTRAIRDLNVLGNDFESTSLRCGASLEMVTHPTTSMFHTAVRAGHKLEQEMGRTFEYVQCFRHTVSVGGLALAGYMNSLVKPSRAKLVFFQSLCEVDQQKVLNLMEELFYVPHINWGRAKAQLYDCMLATNLKSLDNMISKYGMEHLMVSKIIKTAKKFHIDYNTLISWGKVIADDFYYRNLHIQHNKAAMNAQPSSITDNALQNMCLDNQRRLMRLEQAVESLRGQLKECLDITRTNSEDIRSCLQMMTTLVARNTSPTSCKKRTVDEISSSLDIELANPTTTSLFRNELALQLPTTTPSNRLTIYDEDDALVVIDDFQLDVATILAKYITGKVMGREHLLKLPNVVDEPRGKRRLIKVMKYLLDIATPDDSRILELPEPARDSEGWQKWNFDLKQVCLKLQHAAMEKLLKDEQSLQIMDGSNSSSAAAPDRKKATIAGIEGRISKLEKRLKPAYQKNEIGQYFE